MEIVAKRQYPGLLFGSSRDCSTEAPNRARPSAAKLTGSRADAIAAISDRVNNTSLNDIDERSRD